MRPNLWLLVVCGLATGCGSAAPSHSEGGADRPAGEAAKGDRAEQRVEEARSETSGESGDVAESSGAHDGASHDGSKPDGSHGCTPEFGVEGCGNSAQSCTAEHLCCPGIGSACIHYVLLPDASVDTRLAPCASDETCPIGEYCEKHSRCCPVGYSCAGVTPPLVDASDAPQDVSSDAMCPDVGCVPDHVSGTFCDSDEVQWICPTPNNHDLTSFRSNCRDAGTNAVRYCCPPSFRGMCRGD